MASSLGGRPFLSHSVSGMENLCSIIQERGEVEGFVLNLSTARGFFPVPIRLDEPKYISVDYSADIRSHCDGIRTIVH